MDTDILATLQALDPAILTDLVRQDQHNPKFDILDWKFEPLSHEKIIETTGGLYRFDGHGRDGDATKSWAIALKIINRPQDGCSNPHDWCYWKRELLAFQSGLLADLPRAVVAPRCYGVTEFDNGGWVWMEHIVESTARRWSLEHFHRAARMIGGFAGAFLGNAPIPNTPWLSAPFFRSVFADGDWWATFMDPTSPKNAWQSSLVQQAFTEPLRSGVLRIWAEKQRFFEILDRLPQVFCHNDLHRRNLMLRIGAEGQEEIIALDWAFCGPGAVGMDMGELVATSAYFFEVDPAHVGDLEATIFDGYTAGLRDAGWSGDLQLARLGYLLSAALWKGATLPGWTALMLSENSGVNVQAMYGHPADAVLAGWITLTEFLLERAEEARHLISKLNP